MSLHLVGIQLICVAAKTTKDVEYNINHSCTLISEHRSRIIINERVMYVLPECSATGYAIETFEQKHILAEKPESGFLIFDTFSSLAKQLNVFISYGFIRINHDNFHISQAVVDGNGTLVSCYDKVHLFQFEEGRERDFFQSGSTEQTFHIFDCYGFKCSTQICFDLRYPEPWRKLCDCDLVVHVSSDESSIQWDTFALTRALENQYYVLSLNHAGINFGKSFFCPPWLNNNLKTKRIGEEEGYIECIIERSVLDSIRNEIPLKASRMIW